ncbi:MAG: beta-phosphoglucomutase family hydrolase, partial [Hymenobacteraceae bacterium]|nr:beta-phosphoglucomutase family hydrolase [Hymenobacteraceae bacterium]MDX5397158.1 beta-phosphoglucomutase family hydrolase [Hymenobacteraceae bacterium]MDX5443208.1 beta-phosphoglucomutase family hydrolase [Hymenobacteraceae bacterium]MDX5513233.1 beta-phosphoglucomutase family hydrolase [Hymenobacteraceae bacterium]
MKQPNLRQLLQQRHIKALIFDLDGVVTQTAKVHAQAWKKMFDQYLQQRGKQENKSYQPLDIKTDYPQYIDGIPRYDGVRNFLKSRNIELPEGEPNDKPGTETIAGLGNLKNVYFRKVLKTDGVEVYPDTIQFIKEQRQLGLHTAIISASKNCKDVLQAAGLEQLFETRIDGVVAANRKLPGKPAPDVFLEAARELQMVPEECAVFEDARAGVAAGKAGGFALVIGVNRIGPDEE